MQTVIVPAKTFKKIVDKLDHLSQEVESIKTQLADKEPPYGSDEWWKRDIEQAKKEFKKGKGVRFESAKDAIRWLNS